MPLCGPVIELTDFTCVSRMVLMQPSPSFGSFRNIMLLAHVRRRVLFLIMRYHYCFVTKVFFVLTT